MSAGCTFPQRKEIMARLQIREVHIAETEIEIFERRLPFFRKGKISRQDCRYVKYTLQRPR